MVPRKRYSRLPCDRKEQRADRSARPGLEEAGALAAYYSKGRENDKVEIDYIQKKNIKKVAGAAPGFVIYHTNYSLVASPRCDLKEVK